jgi:anti-sigma regulatory factor (Ser/Thr protein kinase)
MPPNSAAIRSRPDSGGALARTSFSHELLLYAGGDRGFVRRTLAPVSAALACGAPVLAAVRDERGKALAQALGETAAQVRFVDVGRRGRNPARILPMLAEFAAEHAASALAISEAAWPGRCPAELTECELHEALVNVAFAEYPPWRLLCAHDVDGLDDGAIEAARRTHPALAGEGSTDANDDYAYARDAVQPFAGSLPEPPAAVESHAFARDSLGDTRHSLSLWAREQGLGTEDTEDLVLAVSEVATNSVRHGGGTGSLRRWREHGAIVCEVRDAGRIDAPLIGRVRPTPEACSGRGVWLANQLCDLVQIRSSPSGNVVRVSKLLR